jgi:hypothetical protein
MKADWDGFISILTIEFVSALIAMIFILVCQFALLVCMWGGVCMWSVIKRRDGNRRALFLMIKRCALSNVVKKIILLPFLIIFLFAVKSPENWGCLWPSVRVLLSILFNSGLMLSLFVFPILLFYYDNKESVKRYHLVLTYEAIVSSVLYVLLGDSLVAGFS